MIRPSEVYHGRSKAFCLQLISNAGWVPSAFREVRSNDVYLHTNMWLVRYRVGTSVVPDGPRIICQLKPEEIS